MPESTAFVATLVGFGRELRDAGLPIGSGDLLTYCAAVATLEPSDLVDVYWAGRTTLAHRRDHLPVYDEVFRRYFLGEPAPPDQARPFRPQTRVESAAVLQVPETETGKDRQEEVREAMLGMVASEAAVLKGKDFAACTPEELEVLRRIMRTVRLNPPRRRSRRTVKDARGRLPDLRRTAREAMRTHGEPAELYWRRRKLRQRRLVLILDVSGSMADYSRHLLQFAHSTRRAGRRVEVFCFGTRLTRITRELDLRRPDEALDRAAAAVVDWDGGTRIGESLDAFVREHGRRGLCRGGIVVICSDGLDRGDPALLESTMERLHRLSHAVVWLNPHRGEASDWRPTTLGMMAAAPHVDAVLSAHDLASLERFTALLPRLR
ncbi:MAG: VWA domain-containing protein [Nocardioides sp.]